MAHLWERRKMFFLYFRLRSWEQGQFFNITFERLSLLLLVFFPSCHPVNLLVIISCSVHNNFDYFFLVCCSFFHQENIWFLWNKAFKPLYLSCFQISDGFGGRRCIWWKKEGSSATHLGWPQGVAKLLSCFSLSLVSWKVGRKWKHGKNIIELIMVWQGKQNLCAEAKQKE